MKKPIIAIFCKGAIPSKEEHALFVKFALYNPVGYNVANLSDNDSLIFDGACGEVPERYKDSSTAEQVVEAYEKMLAEQGNAVGGKAPEPPKAEGGNDPNGEGNANGNGEVKNSSFGGNGNFANRNN